jgi:roundabout axon guidance receptor 2
VIRPSDQRLVKGSTAKFDCLATGNPPPTLFWMKEGHGSGILLPGDKQEYVRVTAEGTLIIGE